MPAKLDHEKQAAFLKNVLQPAIEGAKAGLLELFFVDASHFVMGGVPGRLWGKVRLWVKTGTGRKRYNVLGALNFVSHKIETVKNNSYITSTQVVELLEKLALTYVGLPIAVVMDNARYQRCALVITKAAELGIELIFLPTYSPNLNLIERVWKFLKASVLNAAYIDTFDEYCSRISNFIETIADIHADKMTALVTGNFQLFDKCKVIK
jgi:transposase